MFHQVWWRRSRRRRPASAGKGGSHDRSGCSIEFALPAHGALYKGRTVGTLGDMAAMSMMSGKAFPIGEGGMLVTNSDAIHQRAIAFSHYGRHATDMTDAELRRTVGVDVEGLGGLPMGAVKGRLNHTAAAMGRMQLEHYPARMAEI